jgi:hypothetical protein
VQSCGQLQLFSPNSHLLLPQVLFQSFMQVPIEPTPQPIVGATFAMPAFGSQHFMGPFMTLA